jgi:site-specific DNA-cytosine methylase
MDYGLPQDRRRLYFIGARRSANKKVKNPKIEVPKSLRRKAPSLLGFLSESRSQKTKAVARSTLSKTALSNILAAEDKYRPIPAAPVIVDTAAGKNFRNATVDKVPTLIKSRCSARAYFWLQDVSECAFTIQI